MHDLVLTEVEYWTWIATRKRQSLPHFMSDYNIKGAAIIDNIIEFSKNFHVDFRQDRNLKTFKLIFTNFITVPCFKSDQNPKMLTKGLVFLCGILAPDDNDVCICCY